jgi:hypothetical protein
MIRIFLIIIALGAGSMVGAEKSPEEISERLHKILGTNSFERSTMFGDRRKFIDSIDRDDINFEHYWLLHDLRRLGTRSAVRVLASFLSDDRHTYSPTLCYGAATVGERSAQVLHYMAETRPDLLRNTPDTLNVTAWRSWWTTSKDQFSQGPNE